MLDQKPQAMAAATMLLVSCMEYSGERNHMKEE